MDGFYAARASTNAGASLDGFLTAVHSRNKLVTLIRGEGFRPNDPALLGAYAPFLAPLSRPNCISARFASSSATAKATKTASGASAADLFAGYLDDAMQLMWPGFYGPTRTSRIIKALPYNASAKPIERWFGDFEKRYAVEIIRPMADHRPG